MTIRKITFASVIAATYAALTIVLSFISYGPIQFRLAEALCILPFFFPISAFGLFIGCVLANLLSLYGIIDIVFGSLATMTAATLTMCIGIMYRNLISRGTPERSKRITALKLVACFPPVLINAIVVGAVIAWATTDTMSAFWPASVTIGLQVGLGELVIMYAVGFPLMLILPKLQAFKTLLAEYELTAKRSMK